MGNREPGGSSRRPAGSSFRAGSQHLGGGPDTSYHEPAELGARFTERSITIGAKRYELVRTGTDADMQTGRWSGVPHARCKPGAGSADEAGWSMPTAPALRGSGGSRLWAFVVSRLSGVGRTAEGDGIRIAIHPRPEEGSGKPLARPGILHPLNKDSVRAELPRLVPELFQHVALV